MPTQNDIKVSISEGAKLFGVNPQTVRRAIKSGEIPYILVQGRYKLSFESLLTWSQRHTAIQNKNQSQGIGQYVGQWRIRNKAVTPEPPKQIEPIVDEQTGLQQPDLLSPQSPSTPEPQETLPKLTNQKLPF